MSDQKRQFPNKAMVASTDRSESNLISHLITKQKVMAVQTNNIETLLSMHNSQPFEVCILSLEFDKIGALSVIQKWRNNPSHERRNTGFIIVIPQNGIDKKTSDLIKELGDIETIQRPITEPKMIVALAKGYRKKEEADKTLKIWRFIEANKNRDVQKLKDFISKSEDQIKALGHRGIVMLSEIYEYIGDDESALSTINEALFLRPDFKCMSAKGRILTKLNRVEEAKEILEKCNSAVPDNIGRLNDLISIYIKMNLPDEAVGTMTTSLNLSDDRKMMRQNYFSMLYDKGFKYHADSIASEDNRPFEILRVRNNYGVLKAKEGDYKAAITAYEDAQAFFPSSPETYKILYNMTLSLINSKNKTDASRALKLLEEIANKRPDFVEKKGDVINKIKQSANLIMSAKSEAEIAKVTDSKLFHELEDEKTEDIGDEIIKNLFDF